MSLAVKICGINAAEAMAAAVEGGASYVGLVFYPPSPRNVSRETAAALAALVPDHIARVGLFVDPDDAVLAQVLDAVPLDILQLHGSETPQRVVEIKKRFGRQAMKAVKIAAAPDLDLAHAYVDVADRLLFDAREPSGAEALPGGNGQAFDWQLLAGKEWPLPWMLSGGLTADNLAQAVAITEAVAVDVSSGVEERRGVKSPQKIRRFLEVAKRL